MHARLLVDEKKRRIKYAKNDEKLQRSAQNHCTHWALLDVSPSRVTVCCSAWVAHAQRHCALMSLFNGMFPVYLCVCTCLAQLQLVWSQRWSPQLNLPNASTHNYICMYVCTSCVLSLADCVCHDWSTINSCGNDVRADGAFNSHFYGYSTIFFAHAHLCR